MKKIIGLTSALVLCAMTSVSQANDFSYTYLDGEYYQYDEMDIDSGIALSGALAVNKNFHLLGGYQNADLNTFYGNMDVTQYKVGIGMHTPVAHGTDVVLEGALLNISAELGGRSASESGYEVSAGVRQKINDHIEGNLGLAYTSIKDVDETSLNVGGRFYFNEILSAGVQYYNAEDDDLFKYSLRMDFL